MASSSGPFATVLVYLPCKGLASVSIQGKMPVLGFQAKALGVSDTTGDFRIYKMIEGWGKERVKKPDDRSQFTPAILTRFRHRHRFSRLPHW